MNWSKRGAKILATWITGYSGGLGTLMTLGTIDSQVTFTILFTIPAITGLIVALPQLAKVVSEFGNME